MRNTRYPEGSIAERYLSQESVTYCKSYLVKDVNQLSNPMEEWNISSVSQYVRPFILDTSGDNRLTESEAAEAHWQVLTETDEVKYYMDRRGSLAYKLTEVAPPPSVLLFCKSLAASAAPSPNRIPQFQPPPHHTSPPSQTHPHIPLSTISGQHYIFPSPYLSTLSNPPSLSSANPNSPPSQTPSHLSTAWAPSPPCGLPFHRLGFLSTAWPPSPPPLSRLHTLPVDLHRLPLVLSPNPLGELSPNPSR